MPDAPPDLSEDVARDRLRTVLARIDAAAASAGRDPSEVRLVLATKTQPPASVRAAVMAARHLGREVLVGENRVQELVAKAETFADLGCTPHLIGPLQSNKVNRALDVLLAAAQPGCVESVATPETATRLGARAGSMGRVLDVMVQVNVSGELSKSGVPPQEALELAVRVAAHPGLRLVGLMTIGARSPDVGVVRSGFATLRGLRDTLLASGAPGTSGAAALSMGMSGDLEAAVAEGATIVRVGTAVFGGRVQTPAVSR